MKRVIFALIAVIIITVVIPLVIVEFVPPRRNADSTMPQPSVTAEANA